MSTPSIIPMFAPDGSVRQINISDVNDAIKNGGEVAIQMHAPDGSLRYVKKSDFSAALKAGGIPASGVGQMPQLGSRNGGMIRSPQMERSLLGDVASSVMYGAADPDLGVSNVSSGGLAPAPTSPVAQRGAGESSFGAMKGVASTAYNLAGMVASGGNPGAMGAFMATPKPDALVPQNELQRVGYGFEQGGEFLLPEGLVSEGAKATDLAIQGAKYGPSAAKALNMLARGGLESAATAGVEAAHRGSPSDIAKAGAIGGGFSLATQAVTGAAGSLLDWLKPTATDAVTAVQRGIKPSKLSRVEFADNFNRALPEIFDAEKSTGVPVTDGQSLLDNVREAKRAVWAKVEKVMQRANAPNLTRKALPPAPVSIDTGMQQAIGGETGGTYPAEQAWATFNPGQEATMVRLPDADYSLVTAKTQLGSVSATVPNRVIYGPTPNQARVGQELGSTALTVPRDVLDPQQKARLMMYFRSGSARPELSGSLTNPGILITTDENAARTTLDRLKTLAGDSAAMSRLGPTEQQGIRSQIDALSQRFGGAASAPVPNAVIDGHRAAEAALSTIANRQVPVSPAMKNDVARVAGFYSRPMTLDQSEKAIEDLNADLQTFYAQAPPGQARLLKSRPDIAAREAVVNELRQQQEAVLTRVTGQGVGDLKQTYGSLRTLEDATRNRLPIADRQSPFGLGEQVGTTRGLYHTIKGGAQVVGSGGASGYGELAGGIGEIAAARSMRNANTTNALIKSAFERLRSGNTAGYSLPSGASIGRKGYAIYQGASQR